MQTPTSKRVTMDTMSLGTNAVRDRLAQEQSTWQNIIKTGDDKKLDFCIDHVENIVGIASANTGMENVALFGRMFSSEIDSSVHS